MQITFLATSSLDYPSPRGRWLPLAQELVAQGHSVSMLLLHHSYDQLAIGRRSQVHAGVTVRYVAQMHVYGPIGQRRYFGPLALLRVSLLGALELARAAIRLGGDALHVCKPHP